MAAIRNPLMGGTTENAKVVAIALGSHQRLIALRAVSLSAIPAIIQTMNDFMSQGVDIQLRVLQILLSLITTIHDKILASVCAFVLSSSLTDGLRGICCEIGPFKLHGSRTAVVSPTRAATLRQLVMFIVDKVVEEDRRMFVFQSRRHEHSVPPRKAPPLSLRAENVHDSYNSSTSTRPLLLS